MHKVRTYLRALLVGTALVAGFAAAADAQAPAPDQAGRGRGAGQQVGTPAERADARLTELTAALSLSSAQATQIRTILVKRYTDSEALRTAARQDTTVSLQAQRETLIETANTAILAVLNASQKAAYQALLEQEGPDQGGPGGGRGPGQRGPGGPGGRGAGAQVQ